MICHIIELHHSWFASPKEKCNFKDNLLVHIINIGINSMLLVGALIFGKNICLLLWFFNKKGRFQQDIWVKVTNKSE